MTARSLAPWLVACAAFALAVERAPADPDMYWHLASGRWMIEHGQLLRSDVFTTTIAGQPYSVGEWLGEVILAAAYTAGGWTGVVLLRGLLVAVAALFLTRSALRAGAPLVTAIPIVSLALVLSSIVWTDRPHLFTLALFPLLLDLLLAARDGATRRLLIVPPLLLVWTNLHGGYVLGLAVLAIFALDALAGRRHARVFAAAAVLGALATLLDPGALGAAGAVAHASAPPRFIVEESPPDPLTPAGALFAAFIAVTLAVALRSGGTMLDALLLAPVLVLALSAQRHMPFFAFAAAPYLALRLGTLVPPSLRALPRRVVPGALVGAAAGIGAALLVALATLPAAPDEAAYPAAAVAELAAGDGALLNEYDWGGYLIWHAPDRHVFIDGRLYPFLPGVFDDFQTLVSLREGYRDVLARRGIDTVLLRPDRPLAGALVEDGWRRVDGTATWVLLVRP